jgi:hypothetical protein
MLSEDKRELTNDHSQPLDLEERTSRSFLVNSLFDRARERNIVVRARRARFWFRLWGVGAVL